MIRRLKLPRQAKLLFWQLLARTPFEIRRCLPAVTLKPLDLVLAGYDARGEKVTIVQVGACDGVKHDPIHQFVARGRSRAILLEPNPFAFARLQLNYAGTPNVTLIQTAIGEQDGEANLYRTKRTDEKSSELDWVVEIASFYREHLEQHGLKAHEIERISVPCRSLSSLAAELGLSKIDLLQIDAEGFDAAVVRMALKLAVRPDCINFEHVHLSTADRKPLFEMLKASGYLLSYDDENLLALRASLQEATTRQQTAVGA
jgi:FkbM family methyltransferase